MTIVEEAQRSSESIQVEGDEATLTFFSQTAHHLMPPGFGIGAHLVEYRLQLFHLRAAELRFQFSAAGGERELPHAPVVFRRAHRDQFYFARLTQRRVEEHQQIVDGNLVVASGKIQDEVSSCDNTIALVGGSYLLRQQGAGSDRFCEMNCVAALICLNPNNLGSVS